MLAGVVKMFKPYKQVLLRFGIFWISTPLFLSPDPHYLQYKSSMQKCMGLSTFEGIVNKLACSCFLREFSSNLAYSHRDFNQYYP